MKWIIREALEMTPVNGIWIENGVALGKGIAFMARTLLDAGRHDVKLYAIDPWAGTARNGEQQEAGAPEDDWSLFLNTMQEHAPEELRRIHIVRARGASASFLFEWDSVDLLLLDGDHGYSAVIEELRCWAPTIRKQTGTIGGDDHHPNHPGVEEACREFFGVNEHGAADYEVASHEHDWPTWRKKGSVWQ